MHLSLSEMTIGQTWIQEYGIVCVGSKYLTLSLKNVAEKVER